MLAKISSGKSVFGVLAYNRLKVEDNKADVLYSQKMFESADGKFSMRDCMDSFYPYLARNNRTEKVVFHASLNPDPKDCLSDERLADITQAYMQKLGYGNQPYIVFKHSDIEREHLHIISLRIDETGKKINDSYEAVRSMKICRELEEEFNLVPLRKGERQFELPKPIHYREGDLKHKAGNTIQFVLNNFRFQSFGEFRTMLEFFNLKAEEIKGEHNGKPYNGILYAVTDEKGNNVERPFKASLFGKDVGYDALQKHYELSKVVIEKERIREHLRPIVADCMRKAKNKQDFSKLLREHSVNVIFRVNEQGRIYGVTFLDYQNRAALNGSRLGKEFSANVFNDLFSNQPRQGIEIKQDVPKQTDSFKINSTPDSSSGSVFGILDVAASGDDYEAETFAKKLAYEDKQRRLKAKKKRGRGI